MIPFINNVNFMVWYKKKEEKYKKELVRHMILTGMVPNIRELPTILLVRISNTTTSKTWSPGAGTSTNVV